MKIKARCYRCARRAECTRIKIWNFMQYFCEDCCKVLES